MLLGATYLGRRSVSCRGNSRGAPCSCPPVRTCTALYSSCKKGLLTTQKKWVDMLQTDEIKKELGKDSISALETMSANPNFKRK